MASNTVSRDQAMHLAHAAMAVLVAFSLIKPAAAIAQGPAGYGPISADTGTADAAFTSSLYDDGDQVAFWIFVAMFPILGAIAIFVTILMIFLSPKRSAANAAKMEEGKGDDESELEMPAEDVVEDEREEDAYGAVPRLELTNNKPAEKNKDLPPLPMPPAPAPAQFPNGFHSGFANLPVVSPAVECTRHERHT